MKSVLITVLVVAVITGAWIGLSIWNVHNGGLDITSTFDRMTVRTCLMLNGYDPTSDYNTNMAIIGSYIK